MESMDVDQSSCTFDPSFPERPNPVGKDVTLDPASTIPSNDDEPIEFPPQMESIEPVYIKSPSARTSSPAPLLLESRFSEMEVTSTRYVTRSVTRQYEILQMNPVQARKSLKPVPTSEVRNIFHRKPLVPPSQQANSCTNTIKHFVHSTPKIPKSRLVSNIVNRAERGNRTPSPKMGVTGLKRLPVGSRMTRSKTRLLKMTPAETVHERRSREAPQSLSMLTFPSTPKAQFNKPATPKFRKPQKEERLSRPRNRTLIFSSRPLLKRVIPDHGRSLSPKTRLPLPISNSPRHGIPSDFKHSPVRESASAMILSSTRLSAAARSKIPIATTQQKVTRTSSFVKKVRSLASSIKRTFSRKSKTQKPEKSIDVTTFSKIQQASDVQWVELNSTRSTNPAGVVQPCASNMSRFVGDTDKTFDTSLPVTCFGRGKIAFSKKSDKPHTRKVMKERKSTPFKKDKVVVNPPSRSMKIATPVKPRHLKEPFHSATPKEVITDQPATEPVIPPVSFYNAVRSAASPVLTKLDSSSSQQHATHYDKSAVMTKHSKLQPQLPKITARSVAAPLAFGNTSQTESKEEGRRTILPSTDSTEKVKPQTSSEKYKGAVGQSGTVTHLTGRLAINSISTTKTGESCEKSSKKCLPSSNQSSSNSSLSSSLSSTAVKPLHATCNYQPAQSSVTTYERLMGPIPFPPPSQQRYQSQMTTTFPAMQTNPITIHQSSMRRLNQYPHHIASTLNPWMRSNNSLYHTGIVPVFQTNQQPLVTSSVVPPSMSRQSSMPALHLSGHQYDPSHIQAIHNQQLQHMRNQQYNIMCIQKSNMLYMMNNQNNAYIGRRPINYHTRDPVMTQACLVTDESVQLQEAVNPVVPSQLPRNHPARRPSTLNLKSTVTDHYSNTTSYQPKSFKSGAQQLDLPVTSSPIVPEEESPKRSSCMYAPRSSHSSSSMQSRPLHAEVQRHPDRTEQQQGQSSTNLLTAAQQSVTDHIPPILPSQNPSVNLHVQTVKEYSVGTIQPSLDSLDKLSPPSTSNCIAVTKPVLDSNSGRSEVKNNSVSQQSSRFHVESSNVTNNISVKAYLPKDNIDQHSSVEVIKDWIDTDVLVSKQPLDSTHSSAKPGQQESFEMPATSELLKKHSQAVPNRQQIGSSSDENPSDIVPSTVLMESTPDMCALFPSKSESNIAVSSHSTGAVSDNYFQSVSVSLDSTASFISGTLKFDSSQLESLESVSTQTDLFGFSLSLFDALDDISSNLGLTDSIDDNSSPSSTASVRTLHTPIIKGGNTAKTQISSPTASCETLHLFNTTKSGDDGELLVPHILSLPVDCNKNSVVKGLPENRSVQAADNVTVMPVIKEWSRTNSFQRHDGDSCTQLTVPKIPSRNKMMPLGMSSVFPASVRHDDALESTDDDDDDDDDDVFSTTSSEDIYSYSSSNSSDGSAFKSRKRLFAEVETSHKISTTRNDMPSPFMSKRSPSASPETKRGKCEPEIRTEESHVVAPTPATDPSALCPTKIQEETVRNVNTLHRLRSGVEAAFTENCSYCELALRLVEIKPFNILGLTTCSQVLVVLRDPHIFSFDTDIADNFEIPKAVIGMALSKARGKSHIFARNLTFLMFSIGELYENRASTLDRKRMTAIQQCVQMRFCIDNKTYYKNCVTFINQHLRQLFQKKLQTQIYRPILDHVCTPSM